MKYAVASLSKPGPRSENEDKLGIWHLPDGGLAVAIADGLGGMAGGEVAANLAVEIFGDVVLKAPAGGLDLASTAQQVHQEIRAAQVQGTKHRLMATTLTAAIFQQGRVRGVHCGDCRVAMARGTGIIRLTKDHTEAQRLFDQGKLNKEELANYPWKNILDSALGSQKDPKIDTFYHDLRFGDKLIFSKDGVHTKVFLREIRNVMDKSGEPQAAVDGICELLLERKPEDNYSIVVVFWND